MTCKTIEVDLGGKLSKRFDYVCDGKRIGTIVIVKKTIVGRRRWDVDGIYVSESQQRKRIGTSLYETAAQAACKARSTLVSSGRNPKAHSNDFWEKIASKGKARQIGKNKDGPIYEASCAHASDLSGARKTMPKKTATGRCVGVRKKMTKRCTEHAFKENIRHCMCLTPRPREQCVAIAYSQLEKSCGVHPRTKKTPKKIVAAAKAKKRK